MESLGKKSPAHSSTTHFSATAMIAAVSVRMLLDIGADAGDQLLVGFIHNC